MKIVHLTAPAPFGGLERVVAGLSKETAARGHQVVLVMSLTPGAAIPSWASELASHGVQVEPLFIPGRGYLAERRAVRDVLRRTGAELVHSHGYRSDVLHRGVAKGAGLPIVSTAHGFASTGGVGRVYEWLQVRAWRGFDAVVAVSTPLLDTLAKAGVPRARLSVIRNGFVATGAPLSREAARARLGLPPGVPVFGWVGRLSHEKNPLLAVEALAGMEASEADLCLIGDGPLLRACLDRAAALGVGHRVHSAGTQPDAGALLRALDGIVLSSLSEGTPMVLLEAAMAQVPIVATSVGGVPDLLGDDALLVPSGDANAMAHAMQAVLQDPSGAKRRADALIARVGSQDIQSDWVSQYLELYRRLR